MNPYSALQPSDFLTALQNLLPRGRAWTRQAGRTLTNFLAGIANFAAWFHGVVSNIADVEMDPRTTLLLLPLWEAAWGLPDPCTPQGQTIEQRRAALLARITDLGALSIPYYIALAAALGYTITITEFSPGTVNETCLGTVAGAAWRFAWQVNAPLNTIGYATCVSTCADALAWWGNSELECVIRAHNRGSRIVIFAYH